MPKDILPEIPQVSPVEPKKIVVKKGYKTFVSYGSSDIDELMNVSEPKKPAKTPEKSPFDLQREQALAVISNIPKGKINDAREKLHELGLSDNKISLFIALSGRYDLV